jgi:hypothetical protein
MSNRGWIEVGLEVMPITSVSDGRGPGERAPTRLYARARTFRVVTTVHKRWFCTQVAELRAAAPGRRAGSATAGDPGGAGLPGPDQGSGDKRSPEQEPGVPEVGVPGQRPAIGAGRRRDRTGLHQQPRGGQH